MHSLLSSCMLLFLRSTRIEQTSRLVFCRLGPAQPQGLKPTWIGVGDLGHGRRIWCTKPAHLLVHVNRRIRFLLDICSKSLIDACCMLHALIVSMLMAFCLTESLLLSTSQPIRGLCLHVCTEPNRFGPKCLTLNIWAFFLDHSVTNEFKN